MTQPSKQDRSPRMEIQTIESHRLFTQEILSHYEDTGGEELTLATTPHMVTTCWQKAELESIPHIGNNTLTIPGQMGPPNSAPDTMDSEITEGEERPTMLNRAGDKRKIPLFDGETVVLRKKRRVRGKGRGQRKLQIKWATRTIPCAFCDLLTTDVGTHMEVLDKVQCVAVCYCVLQCVVVYCCVLQCVALAGWSP